MFQYSFDYINPKTEELCQIRKFQTEIINCHFKLSIKTGEIISQITSKQNKSFENPSNETVEYEFSKVNFW